MQSFLAQLTDYIHQHYSDNLSKLCLVLPNRRAKLFLRNFISNKFDQPIWAPEIYSIEDFIAQLTDSEPMDSLTAIFEFYSVYCKIEKSKSQSIDDFLQWAPTLLHDFNEIDQYLVDAPALFGYLSDERAISLWNADGKALTDFQKKYLEFWKSLSVYYAAYTTHLKERHLQYAGLAYRKVAQNAIELAKKKNWDKIIFAGFNALNSAEKKLFKDLAESGMADILWDADDYYLNDINQESGKFLREFKKTLGNYNSEKKFLWQSNNLLSTEKEIVIVGVAQQVGQAKIAGELLSTIGVANKGNFKNHALVLAEENLLMPVLHSLPSGMGKFNVTMGYSAQHLALTTFVDLVFSLQENAEKYGKRKSSNDIKFYYRDLKKLFLHPSFELLMFSEGASRSGKRSARQFIRSLEKRNILFINFKNILAFFEESNAELSKRMAILLQPWKGNVSNCLEALLACFDLMHAQLTNGSIKTDPIESEILFHFVKITKRIETLLAESKDLSIHEIRTIRSIFNQLVRSQNISFIGEPLDGLQIMGMLETRTLDFETVILLSANEGVLPAGKKENSFIPFDLKSIFSLPTYADKDAIFGYHFYRLLQRAKKIYLVYNTETDEFGSGERSRYITQLQHELIARNKEVKIEERLYTLPLNKSALASPVTIQKTDFVYKRLEKLIEGGLSPSLLNVYRNCPLQFYLNYIADLEEIETPEESVDAATFGTVLHAILEESYLPFLGKKLNGKTLKDSFGSIQQRVEAAFLKVFANGDLSSGKNLLNVKVAERYLETYLKLEIEELLFRESVGEPITLLHIEKALAGTIDVNGKIIKLKGKADRIDLINDVVRILDYKTGAVEDSIELRIKTWDLLHDAERNKAFQLLMYAYLYAGMFPEKNLKIQSGIISFRALSAGMKPVSVGGIDILNHELLAAFEKELHHVISTILNKELPFSQTDDFKVCGYCSFSKICNR